MVSSAKLVNSELCSERKLHEFILLYVIITSHTHFRVNLLSSRLHVKELLARNRRVFEDSVAATGFEPKTT